MRHPVKTRPPKRRIPDLRTVFERIESATGSVTLSKSECRLLRIWGRSTWGHKNAYGILSDRLENTLKTARGHFARGEFVAGLDAIGKGDES